MWRALISALLSCALFTFASPEITFVDNGYEGVLVAIHNRIKEDVTILENIKELFRSSSKYLYTATRQRAYFKLITVALPSHWEDKPDYVSATGNHFQDAHVRVDDPNPEYGEEPYTLQPGGCGEEGKYIHLATEYIRGMNRDASNKYGPPGKRLVQEWAHLRYGVFEENGYFNNSRYPLFYTENDGRYPTTCVKGILGGVVAPDGGPCEIIEGVGNDENCNFIPSEDNEVKASLMYKPYVPSIDSFCDDSNHNIKAPNKHNEMCQRSVWSVITSHKDFLRSNLPSSFSDKELQPSFRIVKAKNGDKGRYVLVLDVSGSMKGKPIDLLHEASTRLINDVVPDGAQLGIVRFSAGARILHELITVNETTRPGLVSSLPSKAEGWTAIGKGLQKGVEVLELAGNITEGATLVLLTDGEENVSPYINETIPDLIAKKIVVNCIAFGRNASDRLENLTQATGGRSFLVVDVSGSEPISDLDSAFRVSVTAAAEEELKPVHITQKEVQVKDRGSFLKVHVDPELGLNTVFALDIAATTSVGEVEMEVESPSGKRYGPSSEGKIYRVTENRIEIAIPSVAETGEYNVKVTSKRGFSITASLSVTSEPPDPDNQPIRSRSWLSSNQVVYPSNVKVYAEVKKNYEPVIGATVVATVRNSAMSREVVLRDNGLGADTTKDDGVYSAYISRFRGNGRYGVVVKVTNAGSARMKFSQTTVHQINTNDRRVRSTDPRRKSSVQHPDAVQSLEETDSSAKENVLPPFERVDEAGTFLLERWSENARDVSPPDFVRDLTVITTEDIKGVGKLVQLQWTSPEDDNELGKDSRVELRVNCNIESLVQNFEASTLVNDTWVTNGSLTAEPSLHKQKLTILIPDHLTRDSNCSSASSSVVSLYFALRVRDDSNNVGKMSGVSEARFVSPPIHEPREDLPEEQKKEEAFRWWMVGAALGALGVLIVLILIIFKVKQRRKIAPMSTQGYN